MSSRTKKYRGEKRSQDAIEITRESTKKFFTSRTFLGIVIVIGVVFASIAIVSSLSIFGFEVTPADRISVRIYNAGDLTNMTEDFSAKAYLVDPDKAPSNSSFVFYKSWIKGVNGTAADLSLKIGADGDAFVIRLITTVSGYGNFSDLSFWADMNGIYTVKVFKEPSSFIANVYDNSMNENITGDTSFTVTMRISNVDEGFQPLWQPQIYNGTMSYFSINFTFDAEITLASLNITDSNASPYGASNYVKWPALSNVNRSVTFVFYVVSGASLYEYDFETVPSSVANITSIRFQYGDIVKISREIEKITV